MTDHANLTSALASVQAQLPKVTKGQTVKVDMKGGGSYTYRYADLADISEAVLPLLGSHGLAFTACPTVNEAGAFVLVYRLRHTSGETVGGEYPLATQGGPQAQGSLISYARRYTLCAVTGVAPEDDDGQAAQQAAEQQQRPTVDLSPLEDAIAEATAAGLEGDWDNARTYAAQSAGHLRQAVKKLRERIDSSSEGSGEGSGEGPSDEDKQPAPAASPSAVEPAGSGEVPGATVPLPSQSSPDPSTSDGWDAAGPDRPAAEPFNWREYARQQGVKEGRAFPACRNRLGSEVKLTGYGTLTDACRDDRVAQIVRETIDSLVGQR